MYLEVFGGPSMSTLSFFSPYDPPITNRSSSVFFHFDQQVKISVPQWLMPSVWSQHQHPPSPRPALLLCRLSDISIELRFIHHYCQREALYVNPLFVALDKFTWRCPLYLSHCHNHQQIFQYHGGALYIHSLWHWANPLGCAHAEIIETHATSAVDI